MDKPQKPTKMERNLLYILYYHDMKGHALSMIGSY